MSSSSSSSSLSPCGDCRKWIEITPYGPQEYVHGRTMGVRLKLIATRSHCMPKEIFVWHRLPPVDETGEYVDKFSHVATPNDLEELDVGGPNVPLRDPAVPFYRRAIVDLVFRSWAEITAAQQALDSDIEELWATLKLICGVRPGIPYIIGDDTEGPSSSSSAVPSSSSSPGP